MTMSSMAFQETITLALLRERFEPASLPNPTGLATTSF